MDLSTWVLFGVVTLIALNQLVARLRWLNRVPLLFWGVQLLDLAVAVAVLVLGLPGLEHVPPANWVVGLLLVMHVAQNLRSKTAWEEQERRERRERREARARELAEAIREREEE